MSIDLSKLTPAPWRHPSGNVVLGNRHADLDFIVLARDVFDVMERRHWAAQHTYGTGPVEDTFGWYVNGAEDKDICLKTFGTLGDCWAFMVDADKLLAEREKANSPHAPEKTA